VVWQIDLPDISGTHLHPADTQGAIVSLDGSRPYGSWRWGGPQWTGRLGEGTPGRLVGVSLAVADPAAVAARWGHLLGVAPGPAPGAGDAAALVLDGGEVRFTAAGGRSEEGLAELWLELPEEQRAGRDLLQLHGLVVRLLPAGDVAAGGGRRAAAGQ
jgi:hypothetical protein